MYNGCDFLIWIDVDFCGDLYDKVYCCVYVLIINFGGKKLLI